MTLPNNWKYPKEWHDRDKRRKRLNLLWVETMKIVNDVPEDKPRCVICKTPKVKLTDFRNNISRNEYKISSMCQKCQDKTFKED